MMEFSYNTFTVSCNVCGMDSSEMEGANKIFKKCTFLSNSTKCFQVNGVIFLYNYTLYRSTVGAGLEMPKQRRLSVELWKKTLA